MPAFHATFQIIVDNSCWVLLDKFRKPKYNLAKVLSQTKGGNEYEGTDYCYVSFVAIAVPGICMAQATSTTVADSVSNGNQQPLIQTDPHSL